MQIRRSNTGRQGRTWCCVLLFVLVCARLESQQKEMAPAVPQSQDVVLDRAIAVVNGDVILESDVDEERRFEQIQPYRGLTTDFSRERALQRLIDRTLILQQAEIEQDAEVSDQAVDEQIAKTRKDIPECKQNSCETPEGWKEFLAKRGFTPEEFHVRWKERMTLLNFIEVRFRNGIHINDQEISDYYQNTMLPEYKRQKGTPPPLTAVSKRIEEVLLQQRVSALLRDWLQSLWAQGSVRVIQQDEVTGHE
jgi:hypothetical protein